MKRVKEGIVKCLDGVVKKEKTTGMAEWGHKVSPKSTDPVHLCSLYSYLQNVNTVLLDSRPGPTLSCLVAEKKLNS